MFEKNRNERNLKKFNIKKANDNYEIKLNFIRLGRNLDYGQLALDLQINKDMLRYVPIDTGTLRGEINEINVANAGTGQIFVYPPSSAYGHYQHEGIVYKDPVYNYAGLFSPDYGWFSRKGVAKVPSTQLLQYQDPTARRNWGQYAIEHHVDDWVRVAKNAIRRGK